MFKAIKKLFQPKVGLRACEKCKWHYHCMNGLACRDCEMIDKGPNHKCYCAWTPPHTPCKYFKRKERHER